MPCTTICYVKALLEQCSYAGHPAANGLAPGPFPSIAGYGITVALLMARHAGHTWLLHIDSDELMHPGEGEQPFLSGAVCCED